MRLLVIDGNSIVNRAFYGIKLLSTKDGQYTNALVGFLNILQKLQDMAQPDHVAVAFDLSAPTFRHEKYAAYKAGRKGMPEELRQQIPVLKQLLPLMGYTLVEREGYEADDILGTLADAAAKEGDCFLATGDRDSLQLVGEHVTVLLAATKMGRPETTVYDPAAIQEKYGLTPDQLIDLKALMGDTSDNIPGVPGVGEKTALDLLHKYGSLDAIYRDLAALEIRDSLRQKLENGRESAYLSRELGTICRTAPVDTSMDAYQIRPVQREPLARLFAQLEFFKLIEKMGLNAPLPAPALDENGANTSPAAAPPMEGPEALDILCEAARRSGRLDVLPDTSDGELTGLFAAWEGHTACIPADAPGFERLLGLLEDPAVAKRTHDGKLLGAALLRQGRRLAGLSFDTMLAAYLLNPLASGYELGRLAQEYAVEGDPAAEPIRLLPGTADRLAEEITAQGLEELLNGMEIPLSQVLAAMEHIGVAADGPGIAAFGETLQARIDDIQRQIYDAVGYTFNPVRGFGPAGQEKDQVRLFHQRRCAGKPAGRPSRRLHAAGIPDAGQAEIHLLRRPAEGHRTGRPDPLLLQPDRNPHRPHFLHRAQSPEHSRPAGAGPGTAPLFPRAGWLGAGGRGLFANRTAGAGPHGGRSHDDRGLQLRHGHSPHHRLPGVWGAGGAGLPPHALPGQGGQFRHRVRHRRPLPLRGHRRLLRRGQGLYRGVPPSLCRRGGLHGRPHRAGEGNRLRRDPVPPPPAPA